MKTDGNEKMLRKRLYLFGAVALAAIYSLNGLVVSPIYIGVINDIMFDGSPLVYILDYLRRLLELAAVALAYAVAIYGAYRLTLAKFKGIVAIFTGATLYKYAINTVVDWVNHGGIPITWLLDVLYVLHYSILELLQLALVLWIVSAIIARYNKAVAFCEKTGREDLIPTLFPFKKIYDKENCLLRSTLACAIVIMAISLVSKGINDIFTAEKIVDPILMIVAYLVEVVLAVICYFVMLVTLNICAGKLDNARDKA